MRIDDTSEDHWKEFLSDVEDLTGIFHGRKFTCIHDKNIEIFENLQEAKTRGFHLLSLEETKAFSGDAKEKTFPFFDCFLALIQANQLLDEPNLKQEEVVSLVNKLSSLEKTLDRPSIRNVSERLFQKAENEALQKGRYEEVHLYRTHLAQIRTFSDEHPMFDFTTAVQSQTENQPAAFGAYFPRMDHGEVKQGTIRADLKIVGDRSLQQATFKIALPFREKLQTELFRLSESSYQNQFKEIWKNSFKNISFQIVPETYYRWDKEKKVFLENEKLEIGELQEIVFQGYGTVRIGNKPNIGCSYNKIQVEIEGNIPAGEFLQRAQTMLTSLGMGNIFQQGDLDDFKRQKQNLLFHHYYPTQAYDYENKGETYQSSAQDTKTQIKQLVPEMSPVFTRYEKSPDLLGTEKIYPQKAVFSIKDIPEKMRAEGAVGLMTGVAAPHNIWERVADILELGLLSTEERFNAGLLVQGASSTTDYSSGGGECVFTRLLTEELLKTTSSISSISLAGGAQILIDLDVIKQNGYAYSMDRYGRKNRFHGPSYYKERTSLWEFAKQMNDPSTAEPDNEVMVKNRIAPPFFRGVVVPSRNIKDNLISEMKKRKLSKTVNNIETYNNKPLDQFIFIATKFSKEMWRK